MPSPLRPGLLRAVQAIGAGAALLALLGACGIPINHPQRPRQQRVRPTIVNLTGTWVAVPIDGVPFAPLRLTLRQRGARIEGVLHLPDGDLPAGGAGSIDPRGRFMLVFGQPTEQLTLWLQVEARPPGLSGTVSDAGGRDPIRLVRR